jgi:hypothetical protein
MMIMIMSPLALVDGNAKRWTHYQARKYIGWQCLRRLPRFLREFGHRLLVFVLANADDTARDASASMASRFAVRETTLTQVILISMDDERPTNYIMSTLQRNDVIPAQ